MTTGTPEQPTAEGTESVEGTESAEVTTGDIDFSAVTLNGKEIVGRTFEEVLADTELDLAEKWYRRLREAIQERVSTFPKKYALYDRGSSKEKGVRLFDFRNDVILYTVDEATLTVYILAVCTKGRDLDRHLLETESETFPS